MTNKEFYQETFSQVHSSRWILWEEMERKRTKKRFGKRMVVLAAVICLLAGFSTVAVANGWFGLRDLELSEEVTVTQPDGMEATVTVPTGLISLQGYHESPEKLAVEEWQAFLSGYDDGGLLDRLGNDPSGFEEEYGLYLVYSQEMADKLEEIVARYGLKLHTSMVNDLYTDEALCDQVGGDFLGENTAYSAYMYEDGTFHFDGEIDLPDYGLLDYQFMRCVRGSFTDVMLNVGDVREYREWAYTTSCGVPVTLALGPSKALVLADLPDSFVTINVLAGEETAPASFSSGPLTEEDLERFADSFVLSLLTPTRPADPELPRPTLDEALRKPSPEEFFQMTGVAEDEAQAYYGTLLQGIENGDRQTVAEQICYPAVVTVRSGTFMVSSPKEFLPYYDEIFTESIQEADSVNRYTEERVDLFIDDGLIGAAGGAIWMAAFEDGLAVITVQNPEGWSIRPPGGNGISAG